MAPLASRLGLFSICVSSAQSSSQLVLPIYMALALLNVSCGGTSFAV